MNKENFTGPAHTNKEH